MQAYLDVGQAQVRQEAKASRRGLLAGQIDRIENDQIFVTIPLYKSNGTRGMRTSFLKTQLTGEPKIGSSLIVSENAVRVVSAK